MRGPGTILAILVLGGLIALAAFFLLSTEQVSPLDGGTPGANGSKTATHTATHTPSTTTQPPVGPTPEPGSGPAAPDGNGGGDALPVPEPGSVRLRLRLPEGATPWSSMTMFLNAPGPTAGAESVWTRKTEVRDAGDGIYEATFKLLAPGRHEVWIDVIGLGSAGKRLLSVVSNETTEVDLGRLHGAAEVSVETTLDGAAKNAAGTLAIESLDGVANATPRTQLQLFEDGVAPAVCLPGRYFLVLDPRGYGPVVRTFEVAGAPVAISLPLEPPARLVAKVTDAGGSPATVWLAFRNADGAQFDWRPGGATVREGIVSMGGRAEIQRMPAGRWTLLARPGRSGPFKPLGDVVMEPGKTTEQTFTYRD